MTGQGNRGHSTRAGHHELKLSPPGSLSIYSISQKMYDEHWYSFAQEVPQSRPSGVKTRHRRANSLLQQPEVCLPLNFPRCPKSPRQHQQSLTQPSPLNRRRPTTTSPKNHSRHFSKTKKTPTHRPRPPFFAGRNHIPTSTTLRLRTLLAAMEDPRRRQGRPRGGATTTTSGTP